MGEVVYINGSPVLVDDEVLLEAATAPPEAATDQPTGEGARETSQSPEGQQPSQRTTSVKPEDVTWDEWRRRHDAVRAMAREFDDLDHGDIREYIEGRTTRELSDEEVGQLRHDIINQRVSDLTDIFDEQLRSTSERLKRARRTVRVQAPRGWLRRAFSTLDERSVEQVAARLLRRGHDPDTINDKVVGRMKDEEARKRVQKKVEDDQLQVEFSDVEMIPPEQIWGATGSIESTMDPEVIMEFATRLAEGVASNIRVPDVRVEVPVNVGGTNRKVVRDENGLISNVVDEPDAS